MRCQTVGVLGGVTGFRWVTSLQLLLDGISETTSHPFPVSDGNSEAAEHPFSIWEQISEPTLDPFSRKRLVYEATSTPFSVWEQNSEAAEHPFSVSPLIYGSKSDHFLFGRVFPNLQSTHFRFGSKIPKLQSTPFLFGSQFRTTSDPFSRKRLHFRTNIDPFFCFVRNPRSVKTLPNRKWLQNEAAKWPFTTGYDFQGVFEAITSWFGRVIIVSAVNSGGEGRWSSRFSVRERGTT